MTKKNNLHIVYDCARVACNKLSLYDLTGGSTICFVVSVSLLSRVQTEWCWWKSVVLKTRRQKRSHCLVNSSQNHPSVCFDFNFIPKLQISSFFSLNMLSMNFESFCSFLNTEPIDQSPLEDFPFCPVIKFAICRILWSYLTAFAGVRYNLNRNCS